MALFTYTTKVATDRTVSEIQKILVRIGARSVLYDYDDKGYIVALSFRMIVNDKEIACRLPIDWKAVLKLLESDRKVPKSLETQEQALRVAWRIIKYWVEAQAAIIETQMVTPVQVFLPYTLTNDGKTLYEKFVNDPTLLGAGE